MILRKRKRVSDSGILDNITNMTPFVDFLFTLLIVFMIPVQVIFGNIKVDIPKGQTDIVVVKNKPLAVFVKSDGTIFVEDAELKLNNLVGYINEITMKDYKRKIFILGDKQNTYGRIISVLDVLNTAGYEDVVLVTDLNINFDDKK